MSLFESFLGHAAGTGAQIIGDQIKNDTLLKNEKEFAKMREELAIERERVVQNMRRAQGLQAAQEINTEAERIGKARTEKDVQSKMAADPELGGMQPGDQEAIDKASPAQLKEAGLLSTFSRSAKLDDRAAAAESLGYLPEAKEIRAQQDLELRRDSEERRTVALDKQNVLKEREALRKEDKDKADREAKDKQLEINERRANALFSKIAGGGSKDDTKEWLSVINEQRKGVAAELAQFKADKKAELEGITDPAERKAISARFEAAMKPVSAKIESIDEKLDAVTNRLAGKANAPVIEKKPEVKAPPPRKPMPTTQAELVPNEVYETARGPARWNGKAFEKVN